MKQIREMERPFNQTPRLLHEKVECPRFRAVFGSKRLVIMWPNTKKNFGNLFINSQMKCDA
jgi:hypothetical protein